MTKRVHKTQAKTVEWYTPPVVIRAVEAVFDGGIGLDPCWSPKSMVKAKHAYTPPANGLVEPWGVAETIWVNPPFGAGLSRWVGRCVAARRDHGAQVILLLPIATETRWWQEYIFPTATALCFPDRRLSFIDERGQIQEAPPMACGLVYWGDHVSRFEDAFIVLGAVLRCRARVWGEESLALFGARPPEVPELPAHALERHRRTHAAGGKMVTYNADGKTP